ncbi:MAG: VanZ family protein [Pyrinomonadaceae bacterium]
MSTRSESVGKTATVNDVRRRLWRYAPLVLWVGFIYFASTGSLSASKTSRIVGPLLVWLFPDITDEALLRAHFVVRKAALFFEYAVLALLAARAFLTSSQIVLRRRWIAAAFTVVAVCALLDEFHQSFVSTRTGTVYDSMIDVLGGATALAAVAFWRARRGKLAGRPSG